MIFSSKKATALHVLMSVRDLLAGLSSSAQTVAPQNYNLAKESFFRLNSVA
jgi:hypothetical protein